MKKMAPFFAGLAASAMFGGSMLAGLAATPAFAADQTKQVEAIHQKIDAIGKVWNADVGKKDNEILVPYLKKVARGNISLAKDLTYGSEPLQKIDIYSSKTKSAVLRPVVVYIHGGGLTGGDKDSDGTDGMANSNVPVYFVNHGMVGVNVDYRLYPKAHWPDGAKDVGSVVAYLKANVQKYGGDPKQIFLIGHSAGGTILGTYLFDSAQQGADGPGVAGAMFLSGAISVETTCGGARAADYCGTDKAQWPTHAGLTEFDNYSGKRVPMFIITAKWDPAALEDPGVALFNKACVKDQDCPRYYQAQHMNHLSTSMSLGTPDDSLGWQMRDFIHSVVGGKPMM